MACEEDWEKVDWCARLQRLFILGFILSGGYTSLTTKSIPAFVVLYGLFACLGHMGPRAAIRLMSVESYPTAVRGMGYGIPARFGKAGAAIRRQVFTPIQVTLLYFPTNLLFFRMGAEPRSCLGSPYDPFVFVSQEPK